MTGGTVVVAVVDGLVSFAAVYLVGAGLAVIGQAIARQLPDPGIEKAAQAGHRVGRRQVFTGFDERPTLRYRRHMVAQEMKQLSAHKRHLDRRLGPSKVTSIDAKRRTG